MKVLMLSLMLSFSSVATAGCYKPGPCQAPGMAKDRRPLPEAWAKLVSVPDGATACHLIKGDEDVEYQRYYELGTSPHEGYSMWQRGLAADGWTVTAETPNERFFVSLHEREGATLEVKVSKGVEAKGWSTLKFTPAP